MRVMKLLSIRIITSDVKRLVSFYEMVTGAEAVWGGNELFAEIPTSVGTLAIGSDKTVPPLFGVGSAEPAANRSAIVEFIVDDVDTEYDRLRGQLDAVVTEPTRCHGGATGRCCSAIPTATSSTCSPPRSPTRRGPSSVSDRPVHGHSSDLLVSRDRPA